MATELTEFTYENLVSLTARYNRRLRTDKLSRLPFLDTATGIAQRPCLLHRASDERSTGLFSHVYQYPPYRWKKSKRPLPNPVMYSRDMWTGANNGFLTNDGSMREIDDEDSRSTWAAGVDYDMDSDASDLFDETYGSRRRRRKARGARMGGRSFPSAGTYSRRRNNQAYPNYEEEPVSGPTFLCDVCGVRYRSRAGLNYHMNSQHPNVPRVTNNRTATQEDIRTQRSNQTHSNGVATPTLSLNQRLADAMESSTDIQRTQSPARSQTTSDPGSCIVEPGGPSSAPHSETGDQTCDFCLGDVQLNKKTGVPEPMLRCSDCPRCAHFTCLQFTPNMMTSVRTYRWQCIECKTCWLCGTSENDDQMLFCDDCDRGYHLYCLDPPLDEPPEGSWSCKLCVDHFRESSASYQAATAGSNGQPTNKNRSTMTSKQPFVLKSSAINGDV